MSEQMASFPVRSYRDLIVWQKAIELVQLRRASVSVPSNVAEGQGRQSTGEFKQSLGHARGSLLEVETQIFIAKNLGYLSEEQCTGLHKRTEEVGRILNGLLSSLRGK
jgi:four helix bundle protein